VEFYYHDVRDDILIVNADGGINKDTSRQFVEEITELIRGGLTKILVDCVKLRVISSHGLSALVTLHKRAKAVGGEVKLANVQSVIVHALTVLRLNKVFEIYPGVPAALAAFPQPNGGRT
jgi:anti-sigma B factor antagonist